MASRVTRLKERILKKMTYDIRESWWEDGTIREL